MRSQIMARLGIVTLFDERAPVSIRRSVCDLMLGLGARLLLPDLEGFGTNTTILIGGHQVSARTEVAVDHRVRREETPRLPSDLNRCIWRSRCRVGLCEFFARLLRYWLVRCPTSGSTEVAPVGRTV